MKDFIPLINGREYGWADISFTIGGVPLTGITAIKYEEEQEKKDVYGSGRHVRTRGYGRVKTKATITLLGSTVMALLSVAPDGKMYKIAPFSITVSYMPDNEPMQTHIIKNCEFKKNSFDWKEGDMDKQIEFELMAGEVVIKK